MKNLLSIILIVTAGSLFGQPGGKIESVLLENNTLFQINTNGSKIPKGSVMFSPNLLLDANGNWIIVVNRENFTIDNNSTNNRIVAFRTGSIINSDDNDVFGANPKLNNVVGSKIYGADIEVKNAQYIHVYGDGNKSMGESNHTRGFGNYNVGNFTIIDGNNNQIGRADWDGTSAKIFNSSARGTALIVNTNETHANGFNYTAPGSGWGYGNNRRLFWVYSSGDVEINGVKYSFPTVAPQVGDVLTCVAPGVLGWSNSNVIQTKSPVSFKAYDQSGRLLFIQPVYKN